MTPVTVDVPLLSSLQLSIILTLLSESFASRSIAECATDLEYRVTHPMADLPRKEKKKNHFVQKESEVGISSCSFSELST